MPTTTTRTKTNPLASLWDKVKDWTIKSGEPSLLGIPRSGGTPPEVEEAYQNAMRDKARRDSWRPGMTTPIFERAKHINAEHDARKVEVEQLRAELAALRGGRPITAVSQPAAPYVLRTPEQLRAERAEIDTIVARVMAPNGKAAAAAKPSGIFTRAEFMQLDFKTKHALTKAGARVVPTPHLKAKIDVESATYAEIRAHMAAMGTSQSTAFYDKHEKTIRLARMIAVESGAL